MTVYGYIRVSTEKQTSANQRFEIERHLLNKGIAVDKWINETVSGAVSFKKRRLGIALRRFQKNDILICSELSRLGRSILDVLTILNLCIERNIQVWTVKEAYRLGGDIQSQMLAFVFSMAAQIERTLISERTREALKRIKAEGKVLGRPRGRRNKHYVWNGKEDKILELLGQGVKKKKIANEIGISIGSLYEFIKRQKIVSM